MDVVRMHETEHKSLLRALKLDLLLLLQQANNSQKWNEILIAMCDFISISYSINTFIGHSLVHMTAI